MAGYPNTGAYFNPYVPNYPNYAQIQQMQNYQQMQQVQQQTQPQQNQNGSNGLPYVHGIEGAHAFPMPAGVNQIILWDDTVDSFYIKGYDNMGKPKILAWNDFAPHVEAKKEASAHNMPPMNDTPWGSYDNRYYDQGSGRRYYDDMRGSGRMYRDSEKDNVLDYLHRMMDSESRPEIKTAMQNVLREIEAK